MISRMSLIIIAGSFFLLVLFGCKQEADSQARITIRNDIQDKEYNSFEIDQIVTTAGNSSYHERLKPGESIRLPFGNVITFRVIREYADHANVYVVRCPVSLSKPIVVKLLDIHTNKLLGGCRLTQRGKRGEGGYIFWE